VAHVHVREVGSPGWEWALRFRDWLRADAAERAGYATMKTELATRVATTEAYAVAKEPWFDAADERARAWAARTGWVPSSVGGAGDRTAG
jgi:dephospho-CoA kinase